MEGCFKLTFPVVMSVILKADSQFKQTKQNTSKIWLNVKVYPHYIWKKNCRTQIIIKEETDQIILQCQVENGNDLIWYFNS